MYKQEDWNNIVKLFIYDLSKDVSMDQALQYFASNYTEICQRFEEEYSGDTVKDDEDEPLDVYFERKITPIWHYVYNLNRRVNEIEKSKPVLGPVGSDTSKYTPGQLGEWSNLMFDDPTTRK